LIFDFSEKKNGRKKDILKLLKVYVEDASKLN